MPTTLIYCQICIKRSCLEQEKWLYNTGVDLKEVKIQMNVLQDNTTYI